MIDIQPFLENVRRTRTYRTALAYERSARTFLAVLGKRGVCPTQNDIERLLARPLVSGRPRSAATRNHELAGIRSLATFMKKQGTWQNDPTNDIPFAKESRKDPTFLMRGELVRLFEAAANDEDQGSRARNLAIVAVLSQVGLRVHELVMLDASQVDIETRTLVGVRGKGDTRIDLPLSKEVANILRQWLAARRAWTNQDEPALFVTNRSAGRMSIRSIQRLVTTLWAKCGSTKTISSHSLRHTTATLSITLGIDISAVGDLLRHSSLDITRRYIGLVGARRRAAVEKLAVTIPPSVISMTSELPRSVDRCEIQWVDCHQENLDPPQNSFDVQESLDDARAA